METWLEVTLNTTAAELDALAARLTMNGAEGLVLEEEGDFKTFLEQNRQYWDYVDDALLERMKGVARVKFYVTDDAAGRARMAAILSGVGEPASVVPLKEEDWAYSWQKYYRPMDIGEKLRIVPDWLRDEPVPGGRTALYLNPGLTFGTGSHASTQLCLGLLESRVADGDHILDLGCGSGILSIAALNLGAEWAVGVDIDPKAVDVAYENAGLNGIGRNQYLVRAGDVLSDEGLVAELAGEGPYHVVLANIVADVIIPLSARVDRFLAPGGVFVCSGIIDTRADEVQATLERNGLMVLERVERDGWCAMAATRSSRAVVRHIAFPKGRRVLCISDLHGNLPLVKGALEKVGFSKEDVLLVLGDILERNKGSLDTLRYVMELSRTHTVHALLGNCDNITVSFLEERGDIPDRFFDWWFRRWGEKAVLVQMARLIGASLDTPEDYPAARAAIRKSFPNEVAFLCSLPHIFVNDDYLFVHGGVPREEELEELDAYSCMKRDGFMTEKTVFCRWVIVGHHPVTLLDEHIPSAKPLIDRERHVIDIDGGCTLKADGQINVLILPETPGGEFSYVAYDGSPVMTALEDQEASTDSINIRWGHSKLEVLEEGSELTRCRHLESGRELDVLTEYLRPREDGMYCEDSTDYRLPVTAGERLSVVRRLSDRALCKKDGATGWYFGKLKES